MATGAMRNTQVRLRLLTQRRSTDTAIAVGACLALLITAAIAPTTSAGARAAAAFGSLGTLGLVARRGQPLLATAGVGAAIVVDTAYAGNAVAAICFIAMVYAVFSLVTHARGRTLLVGLAVAAIAVGAAQLVSPSSGHSHATAMPFFEVLLVAVPALAAALVRARRRLGADIAGLAPRTDDGASDEMAALETTLLTGVNQLHAIEQPATPDGLRVLEDRARQTLAAMRAHVHGLRNQSALNADPASLPDLRARVDLLLASSVEGSAIGARLARRTLLSVRSIDLLLCVGAGTMAAVSAAGRPAGQEALAAAAWVPVAAARRATLTSAVACCGAALALTAVAHPHDALAGAPTAALQLALPALAGAIGLKARGLATVLVCLATTLALPSVAGHHHVTGGLGSAVAVELAAAVLGYAAARAAQQLESEIETALVRRRRATDAVAETTAAQRQALARELHDAIAHSLTVVVLHASAARRSWDDTEQREVHLGVVREAVDETLAGLTQLLSRLRRSDSFDSAKVFPSMADLLRRGELIGLRIDFVGDLDQAAPLDTTWLGPLGAQVVEEAITNVIRHARRSAATVNLDREHGTVEVENSLPRRQRRTTLGSGTGLIGLGDRLQAAGGQLDTVTTADGGFRLTARLPLEVSR